MTSIKDEACTKIIIILDSQGPGITTGVEKDDVTISSEGMSTATYRKLTLRLD